MEMSQPTRVEDELRASEERYRTLFESMAEGFAICELVRDDAGRAVDIRWLACNPALERLTGLSHDVVVGHRASEVFPHEYEWWVKTYARVVEDKTAYRFEHGSESAGRVWDLTAFPYEGDRFAVLYEDITVRKAAEELLRKSEARYRELAENLDREVQARTQELQRSNEDVMRTSEGLRALSNRLVQVQEEERRHIARELHDSAGQLVTALDLELASLAEDLGKLEPQLAKRVEASLELVQQLHAEIRTTSYLLHPPLLDETGLYSALGWYVEGVAQRSGIKIGLEISPEFGRLPREIELLVFRLVQEALTNIHRHAKSETATIRIARGDDRVTVEVRDQGRGIPPDELKRIQEGGSGMGIRGMRERLRQFGGELRLASDEGGGTSVIVTIPNPKEASSESGVEPMQAAS